MSRGVLKEMIGAIDLVLDQHGVTNDRDVLSLQLADVALTVALGPVCGRRVDREVSS